MNRVTLVKLFVRDLDEALEFYTDKLGFEVAEDSALGDYRWLLVRLPGNEEFGINLDAAKTDEERALIGHQAAAAPLFSIETDDCMREYTALKDHGVEFEGEPEERPYGIGVLLKDLYGNRIYLNQDARDQSPHATDWMTDTPDARLQTVAGRWDTAGHVIAEPRLPIVGADVYEVLPGGYFLVHHVDVTVGEQPVRAIEIIGEPDGTGGLLARSFDSDGTAELMHVTIDQSGVFHFAGGGDIAAAAQPSDTPTALVRSTLTIAEDRRSMSALWERSEDGVHWHPWMDMSFRRRD